MTPGISDITGLAAAAGVTPDMTSAAKDTRKEMGAAQDFEAVLIGQMLHSMHEEDTGWLGTGDDDDASATAFGFGEDQLAKAIAKGGGLGLAKIIASGLAAKTEAAEKASSAQTNPPSPSAP
jgi:Rod binding domain-containing protein